jgi:radical SAM-linked protein
LTYRITFAVAGRARFLSHLETVDMLLSALRRAGHEIALSRGMKPRPVISLALPRAVGVESTAEIADIELVADPPPEQLAEELSRQVPQGVTITTIVPAEGRPASSRVRRVRYEAEVAEDLDWDEALTLFEQADEAVVVRHAPGKPDKRVDVKHFCSGVEHRPGRLLLAIELTGEGTARPEELIQSVAAQLGATPSIDRIVRTAIELADAPVGVTT